MVKTAFQLLGKTNISHFFKPQKGKKQSFSKGQLFIPNLLFLCLNIKQKRLLQ